MHHSKFGGQCLSWVIFVRSMECAPGAGQVEVFLQSRRGDNVRRVSLAAPGYASIRIVVTWVCTGSARIAIMPTAAPETRKSIADWLPSSPLTSPSTEP